METPYIKNLRKQYAAAIKKAIAKENTKLNNLYKDFTLNVMNELQDNETLRQSLESRPKINETLQKLLLAFNETKTEENK